ncbi:U3 small nucleolar RNA-associated protein 14 homolog A-like [Panonychus citri]|uniref:U3 small nucleolar RNA-associated protein 14 homolog A-like n=1 Tax=Panonychus citri TaxID=50023 RepID=UPI002307DB7C|nr:U3 small nucleolar RNA-associated protein 14 homolog A-like [Panonychus citri]
MASQEKVKSSSDDKLLDIDLDVDPTETTEGKEGLTSLVSTVSSLFQKDDNKRITKRNEPSTVFGELGLSSGKQDKVEIHHLLNSIVDKTGKIKKQIRKITHKKLLPLPLNTPLTKKIERQVNYGETVKEVSKWEPIVNKNREAPQLSFPLEKPQVNVAAADSKFNLKMSNPLKTEIDQLLSSSSHVIKKEKVLTDAEEKYLNQMSIEEARMRHAKLQKMRALIGYQEAKLKRKAKIKSKKYHKMLKKEKLKNEMKNFEQLKHKDPGAALEKLTQLDKMRALERASLKHLNSGKWAKQNLLRAKYDTKTREDIKEQMHLNQTLLRKAVVEEEEENEDEIDATNDEDLGEGEIMMASDAYDDKIAEPNPWLIRSTANGQKSLLTSSEIIAENEQVADEEEPEKIISPIEETNLVKKAIKTKKSKKEITPKDIEHKVKEKRKEKVKVLTKKADDEEDEEEENGQAEENDQEEEEPNDNITIDPKKILNTKVQVLQTTIPDYHEMGADADTDDEDANVTSDDDDEGQRKLIAEAFDGDDVVVEFVQDKREKMDEEQEKSVNNYLPGWGSWAGPGVRTNIRKKKQFIQKAEKRKRLDEKLHNVIISENKDKAIAKFMVKELPYNCKNVPEFEKKFNAPIGPNWNPETQFRFNIEPKIITELGKIIEPINEKALINSKPGNKRRPLDQVAKTLGDVIPV